MLLFLLAAVVIVSMLAESALAARHERRLRAAGAVEPAGDVYPVMRWAYPACFTAMLVEGAARPEVGGSWSALGWSTLAVAKALKWWAIAALGERWTFRVVVMPGRPLVTTGPYRWLRHPNYLAVCGELVGVALASPSPVAGVASCVGFGALMYRRIQFEERELGHAAHSSQ